MQAIAALQVGGLFPSVVGGLGTTVKYFPQPFGAGIGLASTTPGQVAVPGSGRMSGQLMKVTANGNVNSPAGTVLFTLSANTAKQGATPVYVILATSGAVTPTASTTTDFSITSDLVGSTGSGVVQGSFKVYFNGLLTANTTVQTAALTGINFNNEYPFALVVGVTFGTTSAANTANLYQFQIEA